MFKHVRSGEKHIVLNIAAVDFIDSSGLGAIVASKQEIASGGQIVITGTQRPVMTMFKLTRMDKVFQMLATDDEAVRVFAQG